MIGTEARSYPTTISTAFGRVFYGAQGRLYFSQVLIDDFSHIGRCYQRNDPVAEDLSDVLDTDGGEILIQDAGDILHIEPYRTGVLVFCDNGIWYVTGSTDTGFTATSYTANKISPVVLYAKRSVIVGKNIVMFGTKDGCYVVSEEVAGSPTVASITENRISSYWEEFISPNVFGTFDEIRSLFQFINPDQPGRLLVFNAKLNAWYPWKISTGTGSSEHKLVGAVYNDELGTALYCTDTASVLQLSKQVPDTLNDYGNEYESYLTTQPETLKNYTRKKGVPIVSVFMQRTETQIIGYSDPVYLFENPSSCMMSVRFDWDPALESTPRNVYKALPRGFIATNIPQDISSMREVVMFEDKVRGTGKALQVTFRSTGENKMGLLGYSVKYSVGR